MSGDETTHTERRQEPSARRVCSRIALGIGRWSQVLVVVLLACMIGGGLFGRWHRYLDDLSHFQVQYVIGGLMLAVTLAGLRRWRWSALALLAMLCALGRVAPWYLGAAATEAPADLRVMLFNVLQSNDRYADVVRHVEAVDPDVVVFEEVNDAWYQRLKTLAVDRPHQFVSPGGPLRGMAIFSRFEMEDVQRREFGDSLTMSVSGVLRVDEARVLFVVAHPWPPAGAYGFGSRNIQLKLIGEYLQQLPAPRLLIGDLNVSMWSPYYRELVKTAGLVNSRRGFGVQATFPMDNYAVLRVPIDNCLVSPDVMVKDSRLGEPCGSDHAPLIVDLVLPD